MTEVGFYHLTRTGALDVLPKLLGRTLAVGQRALVLCSDAAMLGAISEALWASPNPDWLPHGGIGQSMAHPAWQPIWLATEPVHPVPNGARFLFLVGGVAPVPGFDRIFDLFDGKNEQELQAARRRWAAARTAGDRLTYWQQEDRGWVAKA